jgi:hypothetical protein
MNQTFDMNETYNYQSIRRIKRLKYIHLQWPLVYVPMCTCNMNA